MPDPGNLPTERLEHEVTTLAAHLAAATCRWLLLVAELDRREAWLSWGTKSCAHWLSLRCGVALVTGREHVRVGRALEDLPVLRSEFAAGRLSYTQVRAVARMATPKNEIELVTLARHATGAHLERILRAYNRATRGDAAKCHDRRSVTWHWDDDGSLVLRARLSPEEGALVVAAIEASESDAAESSLEQRRADGFVDVVRAAVGGDGAAIPCEITVVVEADGNAHLADGPALAPETVERLACDAAVVRLAEDADGELLNLGRRTRRPNRAQRRAMKRRDGGCRFPGCPANRFVDAHHVDWWERDQGETNLGVLVSLCGYHHRLVHQGGLMVMADGSGGFAFCRPDGTPIEHEEPDSGNAAAVTHLADVDEMTAVPRWGGERLDMNLALTALLYN
ncbi:MAG: endonuclease [Acidimicrobiales bacterium]|nr:endonuclease [Acidimicrobiales bacterium]